MANQMRIKLHWKRPLELPFPKVWRRFELKLPTGVVKKIKVQDLTQDRYEEAWEFSVKTIYTEEPIFKALKAVEDKSLMADLKEIYLKIFRQNSSQIALPDEHSDGQPILALSAWAVRSKNDELPACTPGPIADRYNKLDDALEKGINVFDRLEVDLYLEDWGVSVESEFRGCGLGSHMHATSEDMARTLGIQGRTYYYTNKDLTPSAPQLKSIKFREIIFDNFRDADGNMIIPVKEFKSTVFCGTNKIQTVVN